jgi:hypothetical protein
MEDAAKYKRDIAAFSRAAVKVQQRRTIVELALDVLVEAEIPRTGRTKSLKSRNL